MTKLMEWLSALIAFLAVYLYLLTGESKLPEEMQLHIKFLPIYLIGMFGVSITAIRCHAFALIDHFIIFTLISCNYFRCIFVGLFHLHRFTSSIHIQRLPRSSRRNPKTNWRGKSRFDSQRI